MAEPVAFDQKNPPKSVTDPTGVAAADDRYPRHLHRADGTYCVVQTDVECDRALAEGWALTPADAQKAAAATEEAPKKGKAAKDAAA